MERDPEKVTVAVEAAMDEFIRDNPYWLRAATEAIPAGVEPDASAEELTSMLVDQVRGLRNAIKILAEEVDELCADVGDRDAEA